MPSPVAFFFARQMAGLMVWQWLGLLGCAAIGQIVGRLIARLGLRMLRRVATRTPATWDDIVVEAVATPARILVIVITTYLPVRALKLPASYADDLSSLVHAVCIALAGWAMIRSLHATAYAVSDMSSRRETNDPARLNRARAVRTQIILANRLGSVVIFLVVGAVVALQFNAVRSVGISLLASASVASVVLGFAAQKSLGTLFAGIQLSVSQPVRMGDNVTFDGHFGTIEDIGLTYVTVKLWDERRLLVPTTRLLDQPLMNWSRAHSGLIGSVLLKVAFEIPVGAARAEFDRIIANEPFWDGNVHNVQVTDAGERAIEIRFLMSARTAIMLWDLRVAVREKLVLWLQSFEKGAHLPHTRVMVAESEASNAAVDAAAAVD
jgi:small-conductance mechanosensitive channel